MGEPKRAFRKIAEGYLGGEYAPVTDVGGGEREGAGR
jgi:hypothetical protein